MEFARDIDKLILGVLTDEPANGYVIAQRIRRRSEPILRPGEGFVYPVLYRMVADGVISTCRQEQKDKPARRAYSLRPAESDPPATDGGADHG